MCTTASGQNGFGSGLQLGGGIMSSFASQKYHNLNASYLNTMAGITQTMADKAVDSVEYAGGMQASAVRNKGHQLVGTQKTSMAANGISGGFTYQNILDDTISKSEKDALAIQYNADAQAQNIKNNAAFQIAGYNAQASAEKATGKISLINGLLSTGSQFAQNYSKWSDTSMGKTSSSTGSYTFTNSPSTSDIYNYSVPTWKTLSYTEGAKLW